GQRTAQRRCDHLLGRALGVAAWQRSVHDAAADELGRPSRAMTGAAGALLSVGLAATTAYLATTFGVMSPLARCRQLRGDNLMDKRDVRRHVEELGRQLGGTGLGALDVEHVDRTRLAHALSPFLAALRRTTKPPLLPGMAPLIKIRPRSASTECTSRFWTVTRSTPIRPAIRSP